ncbi:MAG: tetratricopeptide repeat protein [Thermoplasmata archaeon]
MMEEEIRKSLEDPKINILIIHGPSDSGKSFTVRKIMENYNHVYFDENDYTFDGFLTKFNLKNEYKKILSLLRVASPSKELEKETFFSLISSKIDQIPENIIIVLDHLCKIREDFLPLIMGNIEKIKNKNVKLVFIYHDDCNNEKSIYAINALKGQGTKEIVFSKLGFKDLKDIISKMGYVLPDSIIQIIYSKSNGKISKSLEILKILESKGFIINGFYMGDLSKETLKTINEFVSTIKMPLKDLDEEEKKILLFISLTENGIDPFDLIPITGMDENLLINKLDKLIRLKYLTEEENIVRIDWENLKNEIKKEFSSIYVNSAMIKMADYFRKKGNDYESGLLYFKAGKHDLAYEPLINEGIRAFNSGKLNSAIDLLNYSLKIKFDEDIAKILINIYTSFGDYKKIVEITEPLILKYPDKISFRLNYAEALYNIGEYKKAELIYRDLLQTAKKEEYLLYDYVNLARVLLAKEKIDEAKELLENALSLSKKLENKKMEALSLRLIGNVYYSLDNTKMALEYYKKSLEIIQGTNYHEDIASLYNNIANIITENDILGGEEYYSKALEIAQEHWYFPLIQTIYYNLSIIKLYQGKINDALNMEKNAVITSVAYGNYHLALLSILNMMDPLLKKFSIDEILNYVELALQLSKKLGNEYMENIFIAYKKVLDNLMGKETEFENEIEILMNGPPIYRDYVNYILSAMEMWKGNYLKANEIQKKSIEKKKEKITPDVLIDMSDLAEFLLYENFFYENRKNDINNIIEEIEKNKNYQYINYVQWRINIIKSILNMNEDSLKIFNNNISNLEKEGLKYLVGKLKMIFGLYYFKWKGNKNILNEGLAIIKEMNSPGLLKAYSDAFSFAL